MVPPASRVVYGIRRRARGERDRREPLLAVACLALASVTSFVWGSPGPAGAGVLPARVVILNDGDPTMPSFIALDRGLPVVLGVLTTDTIEQALERAGTGAGNKGFDAALTALEMLAALREIDQRFPPA